ncbi:unnamed protein product, partial [Nesidiocoris tenuis]
MLETVSSRPFPNKRKPAHTPRKEPAEVSHGNREPMHSSWLDSRNPNVPKDDLHQEKVLDSRTETSPNHIRKKPRETLTKTQIEAFNGQKNIFLEAQWGESARRIKEYESNMGYHSLPHLNNYPRSSRIGGHFYQLINYNYRPIVTYLKLFKMVDPYGFLSHEAVLRWWESMFSRIHLNELDVDGRKFKEFSSWFAVPKRLAYDPSLWRISFPGQEQQIMNGKFYLKMTNRFLKFLNKLSNYLDRGHLPFFWDDRMNLLEKIKYDSLLNYSFRIKRLVSKLERLIEEDRPSELNELMIEAFYPPDERRSRGFFLSCKIVVIYLWKCDAWGRVRYFGRMVFLSLKDRWLYGSAGRPDVRPVYNQTPHYHSRSFQTAQREPISYHDPYTYAQNVTPRMRNFGRFNTPESLLTAQWGFQLVSHASAPEENDGRPCDGARLRAVSKTFNRPTGRMKRQPIRSLEPLSVLNQHTIFVEQFF